MTKSEAGRLGGIAVQKSPRKYILTDEDRLKGGMKVAERGKDYYRSIGMKRFQREASRA